MRINRVQLSGFRNYSKLDLKLSPNTTLLYGDNGQGKTNFIEALKFVSLLKSFREEERAVLIQKNADFAVIDIASENRVSKQNQKIVISENKLELWLNNKKIKSHSGFVGIINVVSFVPRDVFLFKDPPKTRRDFIDEEISKLSPAYEKAIKDYNKILKERNEALKQKNLDNALLEVLTKRLANLNREIISKRQRFIARLNDDLTPTFQGITQSAQKFRLEYSTFGLGLTETQLYQAIIAALDEDKARQNTTKGIHKDDIIGFIDDDKINSYASQGQQRLAVITLKLVLINFIEKEIDERPIVVLDDIFSELDIKHQKSLLNHLEGKNQLFITVSSLDEQIKQKVEQRSEILHVIQGTIIREDDKNE